MSIEAISKLVRSVRDLTQTVSDKSKEIDARVEQAENEFDSWKENLTADDINAEGRYVTELYVEGDKDTFYPVIFRTSNYYETEITIFRHYAWNHHTHSDFNASHVSGVLVKLVGQANPWSGNGNYLRTLVNRQRYRQTVANIGFCAYCTADKKDPLGPDTTYNQAETGYICPSYSGFMLRGGRLTYQIVSNRKINFKLLADGEVFCSHPGPGTNVKYKGKTLTLPSDAIQTGDSFNNHSTDFVSY